MQFAFSTASSPDRDFQTIAERAKALGYAGVELAGSPSDMGSTSVNPFLTDAKKIRLIFASAGIEICCLDSAIAFAGNPSRNARSADELRSYIDTAALLGCPLVKLMDADLRRGHSRPSTAVALAKWLLPLGDYAAEKNVSLVIENALSFRTAAALWPVLETLCHPAVGVCWNVLAAAQAGEQPAVSVPTMNSCITYARLSDALLAPGGATGCKLGEGDVAVRDFITRLRGLGYEGWATVQCHRSAISGAVAYEEFLADAIGKLKDWTIPQHVKEDSDVLRAWAKTHAPRHPQRTATAHK